MEKIMRNVHLQLTAVICTCFLLTSTAYLAWTYHIVELAEAPLADAATLIAGYLFQAAGIGLFSLLLHRRAEQVRQSLYAALGLHILVLLFSVFAHSFAVVLAFGCILNLLCGWIGGYYLYRLTDESDISCSAMTLGIGYSAAIIASWLLSFIGKEFLHDSASLLIVCAILTVAAVCAARAGDSTVMGGRVILQYLTMVYNSMLIYYYIPYFYLLRCRFVLFYMCVNRCFESKAVPGYVQEQ